MAVEDAVDEVAERAADDERVADRREAAAFARPARQKTSTTTVMASVSAISAEAAEAGEEAEGDAGIVHPVERQDRQEVDRLAERQPRLGDRLGRPGRRRPSAAITPRPSGESGPSGRARAQPSSFRACRAAISNSITPVATARLSEFGLARHRDLDQRRAGAGERRRQPGLLAAHDQEHRRRGRRPCGSRLCRRDACRRRCPASGRGSPELGAARARQRHMEDRAHRRPHRLDRKRIDGVADEDDAVRADRIDGADDGAEIAGVADRLQRDPDVARGPADRRERRQPLLEDADHGLRVVAPRDLGEHRFADRDRRRRRAPCAVAASRATSGSSATRVAWTSLRIASRPRPRRRRASGPRRRTARSPCGSWRAPARGSP